MIVSSSFWTTGVSTLPVQNANPMRNPKRAKAKGCKYMLYNYTFSLLGMPKIKTRKTKFIKIIYDLVGKKVL